MTFNFFFFFLTEMEMLQELFETNLFLSSSCQVHSENGFEKLCSIFSMKHIRMFLVLHRWWALVVKSVGWSALEILTCSSHKQTALLKPGNSSFVCWFWPEPTSPIHHLHWQVHSWDHSCWWISKCWFLWGFPSSCMWRINRKRFCDVLTLVWRRFPVKPERHRHCSCSQNWHHSPATGQKAEVRLC